MTAKEYLKQVQLLDKRIDRKIEEKEYLHGLALGNRSPALGGERVQTSLSGDSIGRAVDRYVDMEAEIDRMIDLFVDLKDRIINEIHMVDDVRYEELLYLRYIKYMRLEEVACTMRKPNGDYYSFDHIARLHGEALKKFWEQHGNAKF